jgi:hypothetical protein
MPLDKQTASALTHTFLAWPFCYAVSLTLPHAAMALGSPSYAQCCLRLPAPDFRHTHTHTRTLHHHPTWLTSATPASELTLAFLPADPFGVQTRRMAITVRYQYCLGLGALPVTILSVSTTLQMFTRYV